MSERRAPVNGKPYGTVTWAEHEDAWRQYHRRHPDQDAQTIASRGGFGIEEFVMLLGHLPATWQPSEATETWWRRFTPHPTPPPQDVAETSAADGASGEAGGQG